MNPALFYRRKDKTILPADLLATYLTYHANKAEHMKLLFNIRLIEREEKLSLREIKRRKHQLEEELKEQAEYYFGCHRVFSDQSLLSISDSFKNVYLGPYPTKALIPHGRLKELREKLRSMPTGNKSPQALSSAKLLLRRRQRFPSPLAESDIPADSTGVTGPTETLVGQESKTDALEQPPASKQIKSPDQKPEIIGEMHDSLPEVQKLKFKRIQSAPMPKHSREKAGGLDLEGRPYAKQKSKVKVTRAKTCFTRQERLKTRFRFEKEPYSVEEKITPSKQKKKKIPEFTRERARSDRSRKKIGKRPKSSPSISRSFSKPLDTSAPGPRARSATTSRQKQKQGEREEKSPTTGSKMSLKVLDIKSSSLSGDKKISNKEVEVAEEDGRTVILRLRAAARLDFSKAHRLVCKSFVDSETAKTGPVDEETMVRRYLDETSQLEEKIQQEGKRGSRDVELELKSQQKEIENTRLEIKIPREEFANEESENTHPKIFIEEKRPTGKRDSVSHKDAKRHSIKRWIDAVDRVTDHVDQDGECKRFIGHQTKTRHPKKLKISVFKKRNYSVDLKGKQSEVESDMRKKVLEYMKVYKNDEEDKDDEDEDQEND